MINSVDEFIFYDHAQYTKNDWRNRNLVKTKQGIKWLTIPVRQLKLDQPISDTKIVDKKWAKKHWKTISQNYSKTKYFKEYRNIFEELYLNCTEEYLNQINYKFITAINLILGITTKIRFSSEFDLIEGKTARLLALCKDCNADTYLSGPAAKVYLDQDLAKKENISIEWMDYSGYSEYSQLHPPFVHGVSILDLIFNEGPKATKYMRSFK